MLQFWKRINEKRSQKQIVKRHEQELAQQRDMELAAVMKMQEMSREEALIAFNAWWDKWMQKE